MRLAIVGSRQGVSRDRVEEYLDTLDPKTLVISGGAPGVDTWAEQGWLARGGRVISFKPKQHAPFSWVIEEWRLPDGGIEEHLHPSFDDFTSAAVYRDALIAERCEELVAFMRRGGSNGTKITIGFAENEGRVVHVFEESQ